MSWWEYYKTYRMVWASSLSATDKRKLQDTLVRMYVRAILSRVRIP